MIPSSHPIHRQRAFLYSPFAFLIEHNTQLGKDFFARVADAGCEAPATQAQSSVRLFVHRLEWDSHYFNCPMYRLLFSDWDDDVIDPARMLALQLTALVGELAARHSRYYLFAEVPSEDIVMVQALGLAGFRLIETRITYFRNDIDQFFWPERFPVRPAMLSDLSNLCQVARDAANPYDRYHADPFFSAATADGYLATYIENAVKGFVEVVFVPGSSPPGAFLAADVLPLGTSSPEVTVGRIVLAAVSPERRGWHLRLMAEMSYWFQTQAVNIVCMTTQVTNRAVIRNCEKLSYRYGCSSHIFATHG